MLARISLMTVAMLALAVIPVQSKMTWSIDFETGVALNGYNDVRIPGDTGTDISLTDDLNSHPRIVGRVRLGYMPAERHTLSVLFAPLRLRSDGTVNRAIIFQNQIFDAGSELEATYRFDSYRLTYRYDIIKREKLNLGLGVTAKVRDAAIILRGDGKVGEKTNTGFVPLINFKLELQLGRRTYILLEGDALAAPQGRAEDVFLAFMTKYSERAALKVGYRLLEGGADNDEVYNFTMVHYILVGTVWSF
ncbi:MAG: hypothetical protein JSV52_14465 [Candidatus Zixiibacteriota bacterium]|nr:MAG: hypothetical protein JSV52_14465 [candidate division Zixibacteria bacterium]